MSYQQIPVTAGAVPVSIAATLPVTLTSTTITGSVAVTAASLPLPTGASTAAKQPALGTAGTASADVISVQGIASMTALKVDGSAVTQPVSIASMPTTAVTGTFWQTTQPVSGTITINAIPTGTNTIGSVKLTDGTSVATIGNLTNNKALATMIVDGAGTQITSFGGGTQYADGATNSTPTGTAALGKNASNVLHALSLDGSGNLNVNLASGTITGGDAAAGLTGSAVPTSASYTGYNSGGNLIGVSTSNPLPVNFTNTTIATTGTYWQTTQPVSLTSTTITGTVAATQSGTWTAATNADASIGAGTAPSKALVMAGVYNSAAPTPTTGQTVAIQLDSSGNQKVNVINASLAVTGTFWQATQPVSIAAMPTTAVSQSGTWNVGTITTLPALVAGAALIGKVGIDQTTVGTTNAVSIAQIGATTVLTGGTAGSLGIGGLAASGATASGNPVPFGLTFNTTQPTVTTGQAVSAQGTARGGQIVSTGVDTFNVTVNAALPAGTNLVGKVGIDQTTVGTTNAVSLAQIGATTIVNGGVAGTIAVGGMTAVNATSTGNPEFSGGIAVVAANPTKATNGQRTGVATDAAGRVITVASHGREQVAFQTTTITSATSETTVVTAIAAVFADIVSISFFNKSATGTLVTLKDSTAGTTRWVGYVDAGSGAVHNPTTPMPQATVNTNWTVTCGTSVDSIYVNVMYVKNI
jgi:hypothetical protein